MRRARTVSLQSIDHGAHQVAFRFGFDDLGFSTTYWYADVDFDALGAAYGPEGLRRLLFHIALFEVNKLCSLRPDRLDLGPFADLWTEPLERLWRTVFHKVWAQWRYENDDPGYLGPEIMSSPRPALPPLRPRARAEVRTLAFCGGGKDSLVSMRLFERAGVPYDVFVYASSIYGPVRAQHALVDRLASRCAPRRRLRQWVFDDFLDSPVLDLHPELGVKSLAAAETPSSIFGALPIVLEHGYESICLGHERSADAGQTVWDRTGEDVNHQWGKSAEAEALVGRYVREALLEDFRCFSPLKPVHDVVIFGLLRKSPDDVPFMHSCNVDKPWCLECPKCLYVWLGCAAFLPRPLLRATFGTDELLAREDLLPTFRALIGADGRQPFECIGGTDEVKIYLAACAAKGYRGPAVDLLSSHLGPPARALPLLERALDVDFSLTAMPPGIRARVGPELVRAADEARAYLTAVLHGERVDR